jgi:hypothetical protein
MNIDPEQPEYHLVQFLMHLKTLLAAGQTTKEDVITSLVAGQRTLDRAIDLLLDGPETPDIPDGWPPE